MAALTNTEKFAIQGMLTQDMPVEEMSKTLKKPIATIQNYINKLSESVDRLVENKVEVPVIARKLNDHAKKLMVNVTAGKRDKGVAIMTREASEYSDDAKKLPPTRSRTSKNAIYEIDKGKMRDEE